MSDAPRMPYAQAQKVIDFLCCQCGLPLVNLQPVGSFRRRAREVGDIEFIAPMPAPGKEDALWLALASRFGVEGTEFVIDPGMPTSDAPMFKPPIPPTVGRVEKSLGTVRKGLARGFRYCGLTLRGRTMDVPIEFYRYDPGPTGNRGWVELVRTGCADFSHAILTKHKAVQGIPPDRPGSDTYLLGANGAEIPTPAEQHVFDLVGIPFIPPIDRTEHTARNILRGIGRRA